MAFIEHTLGKTHYTRKGRNLQTPVVWLHGGPGGMHRPDANIFRLAKGRQVYCYTQLGGGRSTATGKRMWTISTFVKELDLLVKAWNLEEFHLMGGSWGTTLALEYYLRKGGHGVRSLVFQSPMFSASAWKRDGRELIRQLPATTRNVITSCHRIGATDSKVYKEAMFSFYLKHVLRNRKKLNAMFARKNPNGHLVYEHMWGPSEFEPTGTLKKYDRRKELGDISVPTIIICGEHDEAMPRTGIGFANRIPGCSFSEIKGASHAIWEEKPESIARIINNFLNEIESGEKDCCRSSRRQQKRRTSPTGTGR